MLGNSFAKPLQYSSATELGKWMIKFDFVDTGMYKAVNKTMKFMK